MWTIAELLQAAFATDVAFELEGRDGSEVSWVTQCRAKEVRTLRAVNDRGEEIEVRTETGPCRSTAQGQLHVTVVVCRSGEGHERCSSTSLELSTTELSTSAKVRHSKPRQTLSASLPASDPERALLALWTANQLEVAHIDAFLARYPTGDDSSEFEQLRPSVAALEARESGTMAAFVAFVDDYPGSSFAAWFRDRIEASLGDAALAQDSVAAYAAYLRRFPGGYRASEMGRRLATAWERDRSERQLSLSMALGAGAVRCGKAGSSGELLATIQGLLGEGADPARVRVRATESGAEVVEGTRGEKLVDFCERHGRSEVAAAIERQERLNGSLAFHSQTCSDAERIEELWSRGAHLEGGDSLHPLRIAAFFGHLECVDTLLALGAAPRDIAQRLREVSAELRAQRRDPDPTQAGLDALMEAGFEPQLYDAAAKLIERWTPAWRAMVVLGATSDD